MPYILIIMIIISFTLKCVKMIALAKAKKAKNIVKKINKEGASWAELFKDFDNKKALEALKDEEEDRHLPQLQGHKALLEGRKALGSLYESEKWEDPWKRSHREPPIADYKIRSARRAKRALKNSCYF